MGEPTETTNEATNLVIADTAEAEASESEVVSDLERSDAADAAEVVDEPDASNDSAA